MSDINFISPTGHEIRGVLQASEGAWDVMWLDPADSSVVDFRADGPDAVWDSVEYAGMTVYVDGAGEQWLQHHLICDGHDTPEPHVVQQWRAEVLRMRRGELLRQLTATFAYGSDEAKRWADETTLMLHGPDTAPRIDREKEKVAIRSALGRGLMTPDDAVRAGLHSDPLPERVARQRQRLMHLQERLARLQFEAANAPHGMELNTPHFITEQMAILSGILDVMQVEQVEKAA